MEPIVGVESTLNPAEVSSEEGSFADLVSGASEADMEAAMADVITLPIMLDVILDGIQEFDE